MRESRAPALAASVALHAVLLGAGLIALPYAAKPIELLTATPVTIVSEAPPAVAAAPVQAPVPVPQTAPEPEPTPAPQPAPAPAPTPSKAETKPLDLAALTASLPPAKPTPSKTKSAAKPVDLAALAATLPKSAPRGPAHPAAAPVVSTAPARPMSGDAFGAVTAKLIRLWNPNCGADGADKVVIRVAIHLLPDGRLARPPELLDKPLVDAAGPVAQVAAQRALTAVVRGEPYTELPRDHYGEWKDFNARFPGKEACGAR